MASLLPALTTVGSNTLLSRILGFARDLIIARIFGADVGTDAFFIAFRIPNLARRLFTDGAFAMTFVPILNEYRTHQSPAALKQFVDDAAGVLGAAVLVISLFGILTAPVLVLVLAPGFPPGTAPHDLTVALVQLMLPYLLFISLTGFAGSILNTHNRFGVPAFTPVLLNLSLIGCALWLAPHLTQPIMALAWGVFIAGLAQLALQIPFLMQINLLPRPRFNHRHPGVQRVTALIGPTLFASAITQFSRLLDTLLASFLASGSISWLYYADRLIEFPLGIFAVTLSILIVPHLSQHHASHNPDAFSHTLDWALRWIVLLGVPAAVGLLALAPPLIVTLFYSGEFGAHDVIRTSQSLMIYAIGLIGLMGIKILAAGYYARLDVHTPLRIAVRCLLIGLACNLVLMWPFGHLGLALGASTAAILNAFFLLRDLRRHGTLRLQPGWADLLWRCGLANLGMGAALWLGSGAVESWLAFSTAARVGHLLLWIAVGFTLYISLLLALGVRPRHVRMPCAEFSEPFNQLKSAD